MTPSDKLAQVLQRPPELAGNMGGCLDVRLRHSRAETDDVQRRWLSGWLSVGSFELKAWVGRTRNPIHHKNSRGTPGGTRTPNLLIRTTERQAGNPCAI